MSRASDNESVEGVNNFVYSILPAIVSLLFLAYGAYVLGSRGTSRAALAFFLVCLTTFTWQFAWAILFQISDRAVATMIARAGYVMILFLPTTLYHFVVELTRRRSEMRAVNGSYLLAGCMALGLFTSDWIVKGVSPMFFGFYPDAGVLHPLHVLQTGAVVRRAAVVLWQEQRVAVSTERLRLRYCLASLLIYCLAAIDYLCN